MTTRNTPEPLPGWPRLMKARFAAAYLGVSRTKFLMGVKQGRYPKPRRDGGNMLWDRVDLDHWVDTTPGDNDGVIASAELVRQRLR